MILYPFISFAGMLVLMGIAWLFSADRRVVNVRVILWGVGLQLLFGAFVFLFPPGIQLFIWINDLVVAVLGSASAGAEFVFGRLALPPGTANAAGEPSLGFFLAFQGLPTIIFFSAIMAILYHYGIMQRVIGAFARLFTRLMGISGAESLCAASNIFVGAESSLTIRPYLERMTPSELTVVLAAGMSTVASNVLALYVFSLRDTFPSIAGHLVSASFLSAPAAIVMAKLLVPETGNPDTLGTTVTLHHEKTDTLMEAIIGGANAGVRLIVGIVALLVAVLGLVSLANLIIGGIGMRLNMLTGLGIDWSLAGMLGYVFYPLTLIIGVPFADAGIIARIIGERVIVTEVTAYQDLATALGSGALTNPRSAVMCAYALCGFAHLASLAIFTGGVTAIAPSTTPILSRIGLRALLAATLACLMTACVAGIFFSEGSVLFAG